MGSDEDKTEKKRLKAEYKLEKKRLKAEEDKADGQPSPEKPPEAIQKQPEQRPVEQPPPKIIINIPKEPWYKDPRWISAIIGAITLSLALIAYFTDLL